MLDKLVTGGQTGADQAAWRAAAAFSVACGGWMPSGFLTEDGCHPEFAERFGAAEMPTDSYSERTEQNVKECDGTLWFGETPTLGARTTVEACYRLGKPCLPVSPSASFEPLHVATWIMENKIRILNVAGNREGEEPGIGDRVETFVGQVLEQLGHKCGA